MNPHAVDSDPVDPHAVNPHAGDPDPVDPGPRELVNRR